MNARASLGLLGGATLLASALAAAADPVAAGALEQSIEVHCSQPQPLQLHCDYRPLAGAEPNGVSANWNGTEVSGTLLARYPQAGDSTAVLLLVDTSDPARHAAVARAIEHVNALIDAAPAHMHFGVASFDSEMYVLAPPGSSRTELHSAAATLAARGKTTELYRNVRDAVRVLAKTPASRRDLIVLSDGLAEDFAYHHEDVIAAARGSGVIINSIGLPRSVPLAVALQTLRRLSDDTGGQFVQTAQNDFALPPQAVTHLLTALDAGGTLAIDLTALAQQGAHGAFDLALTFAAGTDHFSITVPVV